MSDNQSKQTLVFDNELFSALTTTNVTLHSNRVQISVQNSSNSRIRLEENEKFTVNDLDFVLITTNRVLSLELTKDSNSFAIEISKQIFLVSPLDKLVIHNNNTGGVNIFISYGNEFKP